MNRPSTKVLSVLFLLCALSASFLTACGGKPADASSPLPMPPTPTVSSVSVSPSAATLTAGQTPAETQQFTATVSGTTGFNHDVTWSLTQGPGTLSSAGLYTAPASVSSQAQTTVRATSVQTPQKFGEATITINPAPQPPTISVSPVSATVVLGGSQPFATMTTGFPTPTVTGSLSGPGSLDPVTFVYNIGREKPASWRASASFAATSSAGTASALAAITLEYPTPTVTAVTPSGIFCPRECDANPITVFGSGFYEGGSFQINNNSSVVFPVGVAFDEFSFALIFDTPRFITGFRDLVVSSPPDGHGGGTSNVRKYTFFGNERTLAVSSTEIFQLDQAGGMVVVFDKVTRARLREFPVGGSIRGIAVDDVLGNDGITRTLVALAQPDGVAVWTANGQPLALISDGRQAMGVDIRGGYVCATQDQDNSLSCSDLRTLPWALSPLVSTGTGSTPMNVAMTVLAGQLTAVVLNAGEGILAWTEVPQMAQVQFANLPGFTKMTNLPHQFNGGWSLTTFSSGSLVGTAAVLSRFDRKVWFVNLTTKTVSGPFAVEAGDPLRITANNANGTLVVAFVDTEAGLTRFLKVDSSGNVTALNATTTLLATGMEISTDGAKIIVANRGETPEFLPLN